MDAVGGVAGDMLAGALLDLGWPLAELQDLTGRLGLAGVKVEEVRVQHHCISARRILVHVESDQPHRRLPQVQEALEGLPPEVAAAALRVFQRLAEAEAQVHGCAPEEVHFHEVGAADALVDVTAFCGGLAWLGWPRLISSPLPLGRGFVRAAHGELPLPAPAVLHLLKGAPVTDWPEPGETVTPTGAALVTTLAQGWGQVPSMRLMTHGTGGGSRPSGARPGLLRLLLGEVVAGQSVS
ncbi:MAG: LarC family nickel insertion protein [Deltaproteobacteria bacterium]|nr:LarC family nickel insertion protein [Deltaproteobacteria bacterium]